MVFGNPMYEEPLASDSRLDLNHAPIRFVWLNILAQYPFAASESQICNCPQPYIWICNCPYAALHLDLQLPVCSPTSGFSVSFAIGHTFVMRPMFCMLLNILAQYPPAACRNQIIHNQSKIPNIWIWMCFAIGSHPGSGVWLLWGPSTNTRRCWGSNPKPRLESNNQKI